MSADNTIVVLGTLGVNRIRQYRVAHVQAWDNFDYYKNNEPEKVHEYLGDIFGKCKVHESLREAEAEAHELLKKISYVEYGIIVEETDYEWFS